MSDPVESLRAALAGRAAWLVGGVVRDRALGRAAGQDIDVAVDGDPGDAAEELVRTVRRGGGRATRFALSDEFGSWRVVGMDDGWQVDLGPLRGGSLEADLRLRDFTVNAMAEPVQGGAVVDPLGGGVDLRAGRLRAAGPRAFEDDPLRVLRLVRIATQLALVPEPGTVSMAAAAAGRLGQVAPERVFAELCGILSGPAAVRGLAMMDEVGAGEVVLPELGALKGMSQSRFHHRDVYGHTMEVVERAGGIVNDPGATVGVHGEEIARLLAEPLAGGLTRGSALMWGAVLHDIAKPATRAVRADGRVTFVGHDVRGSEVAMGVLGRLRAGRRLQSHVAALVRHHLRLGFLVHEPQPLSRRTVFSYLSATEPVEVEVTLLSVADRLATRGDRASESIDAHMRLARAMVGDALRWRGEGRPAPLVRGDILAGELGIEQGPRLGDALRALEEAQYVGEVRSREEAVAYARRHLREASGRACQ